MDLDLDKEQEPENEVEDNDDIKKVSDDFEKNLDNDE